MLLSLKTLLLLLPIAWSILRGPGVNEMFLLGGLFATSELLRTGNALRMLSAWPIFLLATLYALMRFLQPKMPSFQDLYVWPTALVTVFYAVPAGFCLWLWSREGGQEKVLWGYALFCLTLTAAGSLLVSAAGPENLVHVRGDDIDRSHPDPELKALWIFRTNDLVMDSIPISLFAVASLPIVLLPRLFRQKLVVCLGAALGVCISLAVLTRTMFLAALATLPTMLFLQYRGSYDRSRYLRRLFLSGLAATALGCVLLLRHGSGNIALLLHRFAQAGEDGRISLWRQSLSAIASNPMGGGFHYLRGGYWAHSVFLDFLLAGGLPAGLPMLALYGFVFAKASVAIRRTNIMSEPMGVALIGGLIASFSASMVGTVQACWIAFTYLAGSYAVALLDAQPGGMARAGVARHSNLPGQHGVRIAPARQPSRRATARARGNPPGPRTIQRGVPFARGQRLSARTAWHV